MTPKKQVEIQGLRDCIGKQYRLDGPTFKNRPARAL